MANKRPSRVEELLGAIREGEPGAKEELVQVVYDEVRERAAMLLRRERVGHTLWPTDLVNEVLGQKLNEQALKQFENHKELLGAAIKAMQDILVDHARRRRSKKRGGHLRRVPLDDVVDDLEQRAGCLVRLDDALKELKEAYPRQHDVIQLRFFGKMEHAAIARSTSGFPRRRWNATTPSPAPN